MPNPTIEEIFNQITEEYINTRHPDKLACFDEIDSRTMRRKLLVQLVEQFFPGPVAEAVELLALAECGELGDLSPEETEAAITRLDTLGVTLQDHLERTMAEMRQGTAYSWGEYDY